ncbi:hypothetical protein AB6A40_004435 [Gnathostoma spinigerum]|uniref:Uncharacterized protein n=1 Tax=Gnathostoma spinigerum TaxID=75299 RepID=A0ABD6EJX6_9BILA
MSVAGSSRSTIPLLPNLTPSQVLTIRKSWKHINTKGLRTVIRLCFQRLESGSKAVTLAFSSVNNELSTSQAKVRTIANHVKFLVNLIDRIIDGNEAVVSELKTVGASHGFLKEKYGFGVQDLEKFGELMVEAFVDLDGIKQSKETVRNWRLLIASLIDQLRVGFDNQLRMERRHSTASFSCLASPSSYSENLADSRFRRRSIPTYDRSRWSESDPSSRRNRSNS